MWIMLRHDYSFADKALTFGMTLTLAVMAFASFALRFLVDPIQCWFSAHLPSSMISYAHTSCFQRTHHIILANISNETMPVSQETHHQWVPITLGLMAVLCLAPHCIWRALSGLLWLDLHPTLETLTDNQRGSEPSKRHVLLRDLALLVRAGLAGGNWTLSMAALGRRALTCMVCLVQLILIFVLFKPQLAMTGKEERKLDPMLVKDPDYDFNTSLPLPEQFICPLAIQQHNNVQMYEFQCILPLAQVYNRAMAFLFYLFLLMLLVSLLDMLGCICRICVPALRNSSLKYYLSVGDAGGDPSLDTIKARFLESLGPDGYLLLSLTGSICGPLAAADLTNHLFYVFKASPYGGPVGPVAMGPPMAPGPSHPAASNLQPALSASGPEASATAAVSNVFVSTPAVSGGATETVPLMSVQVPAKGTQA